METNYSTGIERNEDVLAQNDADHTKWSNPLEIRSASQCCVDPYLMFEVF